jgi:hypothetical protein
VEVRPTRTSLACYIYVYTYRHVVRLACEVFRVLSICSWVRIKFEQMGNVDTVGSHE